MLAHELRNPLAPIRNAGEILSRNLPADVPMRTAVHTIERQVTHLTRLVDDLLDVSRITQGRIELRRQPTSVADVVARSLETVDPLIRRKRHKVSIAASHWNLYVNVDPGAAGAMSRQRAHQCRQVHRARRRDPHRDAR